MNLHSKFFERLWIRRPEASARAEEAPKPHCAWAGCDLPGTHKAPRGPNHPGHYVFCLEHVRQYNKDFDFFSGMSPDEVEAHILRNGNSWSVPPDWNSRRAGAPKEEAKTRWRARDWSGRVIKDPFNVFARYARAQARNPFEQPERGLQEADRRALEMLGLDGRPDKARIKSAYKSMVKKHHPDANGGDRGSEERLRHIIAAYTHLKAKGFV